MRRPIRTFALILSALLAGSPAIAPARVPEAAKAASAAARGAQARPALWKISDSDTTIYLFGTIHAMPAGLDWFGAPLQSALKSSGTLVTELPDTSPAEMQSAVMANATLPEGQTLRGLLTEAERTRYEKAMAGLGLPVEAFDRVKPWFAALSMALTPVRAAGYDPASGADARIAASARELGIPRIGLETASYQMSLFASLPMDTQKRYLLQVIEDLPEIPAELAGMLREWSAGNAEKVGEIESGKDDPALTAALLTNRNRIWSAWVKTRMDKPGTVFIAVGAGHLAGKDSVQALLANSGIKAVRVQ